MGYRYEPPKEDPAANVVEDKDFSRYFKDGTEPDTEQRRTRMIDRMQNGLGNDQDVVAEPNKASRPSQRENIDSLATSRPRRTPARKTSVAEVADILHDEALRPPKYSEAVGLGDQWATPLTWPPANKKRATVEWTDLFKLDTAEFLNDSIIELYLRYLEQYLEREHPDIAKQTHIFNTFFYDTLVRNKRAGKVNYAAVKNWTKNINLFSRKYVIIPINQSAHWYLAIICNLPKLVERSELRESNNVIGNHDLVAEDVEPDIPILATTSTIDHSSNQNNVAVPFHISLDDLDIDTERPRAHSDIVELPSSSQSTGKDASRKKSGSGRRKSGPPPRTYDINEPVIMILDSLGDARFNAIANLKQYLIEEASDKRNGLDISEKPIKGMTAKGIPTQPNFSDCGLFLCAYLEKFVTDPADLIHKLFKKQVIAKRDLPVRESEDLRSRLRNLIIELHRQQEGQESEVPTPAVGNILLGPPRELTPVPESEIEPEVDNAPKAEVGEAAIEPFLEDEAKPGRLDRPPKKRGPDIEVTGTRAVTWQGKHTYFHSSDDELAGDDQITSNTAAKKPSSPKEPTERKNHANTRATAYSVDDEDETPEVIPSTTRLGYREAGKTTVDATMKKKPVRPRHNQLTEAVASDDNDHLSMDNATCDPNSDIGQLVQQMKGGRMAETELEQAKRSLKVNSRKFVRASSRSKSKSRSLSPMKKRHPPAEAMEASMNVRTKVEIAETQSTSGGRDEDDGNNHDVDMLEFPDDRHVKQKDGVDWVMLD